MKQRLLAITKFDLIDAIAAGLFSVGIAVLVWGTLLEPPGTVSNFVVRHFGDWSPGFITDGVILFLINRVLKHNERKRVITQAGSLSNEFALDAIDRCREEGWMFNGVMQNARLAKARLATADLSEGKLAGASFSYADLTGADMSHADLRGANFTGANLSRADLRWSDLTGAVMRWADLRQAQIDGAVLDGIDARYASIDPEMATLEGFQSAIVGGFLTPAQVEMVRDSFEQLLLMGETPFTRFYDNLFAAAPEVESMFSISKVRQSRKFLQSMQVIVDSLDHLEAAGPVLQRLGARHKVYGVKPEHFAVVETALIRTLGELLGGAFTDEVREAWEAAYDLIAESMKSETSE